MSMIIPQIEIKGKLSVRELVKYQLLTHCFVKEIKVSDADLDCLTTLAISGEQELMEFCNKCSESGIFKSSQTVRNALRRVEKKQLIVGEGKHKRKIKINPELGVQPQSPVILNCKFLAVETD